MVFIIIRIFFTFILILISIPIYILKIFGEALLEISEWFDSKIVYFVDELSLMKLSRKIRDDNQALKDRIEFLENNQRRDE